MGGTKMEVEMVNLTDLKPDENNPNIMTTRQQEQLKESLTKYGFMQPLVVTHNLNIVNGNQKYLCITHDDDLKRTFQTVPCYVLPEHTTEADRLLIQQALNKIHGEHDRTRDAMIFQQLLKSPDTATSLAQIIGKKEPSITRMIERQRTYDRGETVLDHKGITGEGYGPTVQESLNDKAEPVVWQLGNHTITCGDCTRVQPPADVTLLLADPPYGIDVINEIDNTTNTKSPKGHTVTSPSIGVRPIYPAVVGDDRMYDPTMLLNIRTKHTIIWGAHQFCDKLPGGHQWITWLKKPPTALRKFSSSDAELAWTSHKGGVVRGYYVVSAAGDDDNKDSRVHPTQKPIQLFRDIVIDYTTEGDIIYDPYLGSGTSVMAAEQTNRICHGVEIDPAYVEATIRRWQTHTGGKAIKL